MPEDHIICASYTHARRHPMVLGRIAGWTPPFQLTVTQIGVLLAAFALVTWTWRWWGPALPDTAALLVAVGTPVTAAWAVRRVRVEGRSLPRAALGWVLLWCVPSTGTVGGRPARDGRRRTTSARVWIATDPAP
jgi:hypothetical protein